jgi:hypothetical protein
LYFGDFRGSIALVRKRAILVASTIFIVIVGCGPHQVRVDCLHTEGGKIEIRLQKVDNVNGFTGLEVWQKNAPTYLWIVNLNYFPTNSLVYGELPPRTPYYYMTQIYPNPPQSPVAPAVGQVFYVRVEYEYNSFVPPDFYGTVAIFKFQLTKDGEIVSLGRDHNAKEPLDAWPKHQG